MFNLNTGKNRQVLPATNPASYKEQAENQTGFSDDGVNSMVQNAEVYNPQIEAKYEEVEAQRRAFMAKNPEFNMSVEIQNRAFVDYIWGNGLTVEEAYFLVHKDELLEQARYEAMESLRQRQNRIPENGAGKNRPAIAKKNPKDLSDKEIDAIIERAKNGEKITF